MRSCIVVPSDKSISHRALIFSAISNGRIEIENLLFAEDCLSTADVLSRLGISISLSKKLRRAVVIGKGKFGFTMPRETLFAGNSGTTMRIMTGLLAGQAFDSVIDGDASLRRRPMLRVISPLLEMGARIRGRVARIKGRRDVFAPLEIEGSRLIGRRIVSNVASAQVKTAVILAGLCAEGRTYYREPILSRDHTERLLKDFGIHLIRRKGWIIVDGGRNLISPGRIFVPGDISSAAFFMGYAAISPSTEVVIKRVGINPSRLGVVRVFKRMGVKITFLNKVNSPEPYADIVVKSSNLKAVQVKAEEIPSLIDEVPIIAVVAAFAKGKTQIEGVDELRVKESDRLYALAYNLGKFGIRVDIKQRKTRTDLIIHGGRGFSRPKGMVKSFSDHRIAMSMAVLLARLGLPIEKLDNRDCTAISYPEFWDTLEAVTKGVDYEF